MKKTSYSHSKKSFFGAFASAFLIVSMALLPAASTPFVYAANEITIVSSSDANGTISPSGTNLFDLHGMQTFVMTPNSGYTVGSVTIDGAATSTFGSYTFNDLQADHTIAVTFTPLSTTDTINPSDPGPITTSRVGTSTPAQFSATWAASTDNVAVAGYSYTFDQDASSTPDATVDTTDTIASSTLADGAYFVHVRAIDTSGNTSGTVESVPFRVDTVPPVITLVGSASVNVNQGDTYTDAGATGLDNIDGTINVTATGTVDTSTLGDYTVTYTLSDMSGNEATPVTRTVHVVSSGGGSGDITLPVGPTAVISDTHAAGVTSSSSAATVSWDTATDNVAVSGYSYIWDHSSSTTPNATVDVASTSLTTSLADGTWYFHVVSVDSSGNISSPVATFGPVVIDTSVSGGGDISAPTNPGTVTVSRVGTSTPALFSATWVASTDNIGVAGYSYIFDQADGTIPDNTIDTTDTIASSTLADGVYVFHVKAIDAAGNTSSTTSSVNFRVDTVAPVITLLGNADVTVSAGDTYTDAGATGLDNIDGTITVASTGTVDTSTVGTYTIIYTLSDTSGNAATPIVRTVHVVSSGTGDTTSPTVPGSVTVSRVGTSTPGLFNATWSASTDNVGVVGYSFVFDQNASTTPDATVDSTDTIASSTLSDGGYFFHVLAVDAAGNVSASQTVSFRVDTVLPVVTLVGNADVSVTLGSVYVDNGATAFDNIDGQINGNIATTGTVDTSTLGDYTITYIAHDESGNLSLPVTRTVHVVAAGTGDINAPSAPSSFNFSRIGSSLPAVIRVTWASSTDNVAVAGYSYVFDQNDGTIPDGTVNATSAYAEAMLTDGVWVLHIRAVDTSGNLSATQEFTFRVDTVLPIVTLNGGDMTLTVGSAFTDPGATASDNVDGTINGNIAVTGSVDANTIGTYTLTYIAHDESGNLSTPVTRTVHIVSGGGGGGGSDTTLPLGPTSITSDTHTAGATSSNSIVTVLWNAATDNVGIAGYSYVWDSSSTTVPNTSSDVTATSLTTSLSNGTWYFHVRSIDTSGNASSPSITFGPVIISASGTSSSDTTNPTNPTSLTVARVGTNIPGVFRATWGTSTDNVGIAGYSYVFDQNASTIPDGAVDTQNTFAQSSLADGAYFFHVKAIDTSGNTSGTVHTSSFRVDTVSPVITLTGNYHVFVTVGDTYSDAGATALDSVDGSLSVTATGTVNTLVPGDYIIMYTVSDTSGNQATPVIRTVHVVSAGGSGGGSTLPPTIVTLGSNPVTVTQGSVYVDLGAVANDAVDGNISSQIVTTGTVDTSTVGTYVLTYSIQNSAHLTATSTRTVHVIGSPFSSFFNIVATAGAHGTISPSGTSTILQGFSQTYAIMPNVGYIISALVVDGIPRSATSSFTFSNIQANHTISASFGTTTPPSSYLPPVANFRASIDALTVMFIDLTESGTSTASSTYTYAWNFGDSATTSAVTVGLGGHHQMHTYAAAGTYPVMLTIADQFGNVSTSSATVTVSSPSIGSTGNSGITISYGGGGFVYSPIPLNANTLVTLNNPEATSSIVITDIHFLPLPATPVAIVRTFRPSTTFNLRATTKIVPLKGKSTTVIKAASSTSATTSGSILSKIETLTFPQNVAATASVQAAAVKEKAVSIGQRLKNLMSKLLGR